MSVYYPGLPPLPDGLSERTIYNLRYLYKGILLSTEVLPKPPYRILQALVDEVVRKGRLLDHGHANNLNYAFAWGFTFYGYGFWSEINEATEVAYTLLTYRPPPAPRTHKASPDKLSSQPLI